MSLKSNMSFCTFKGAVLGKTFNLDRHEARSRRTRSHLKTAATLTSLSITVASSAQQAVQWRVEDGGNGHWYRRLAIRLDWPSANSFATANGGHLATLTSAAENSFVLANGADRYDGLGGFAPDGQGCNPSAWAWVTGEPWSFTSWASPEPNYCSETILAFAQNGFPRWNNYFPSAQLNYWVEWSADCNGDGIVDYGQVRNGSLADYDGDNIPDCCEAGTPCTVGNYPVQWRVEEGGNGHWYSVSDSIDPPSWTASRVNAESRGGTLATIHSVGENTVVTRLAERTNLYRVWIGCRFVDGQEWRWVDGSELGYLAWGGAECGSGPYPNDQPPNGSAVAIANCDYQNPGSKRVWDDFPAVGGGYTATPAIIEWSADCNADGIVDYGQILQGQLADTDSNGIPDICEIDPCPGDVVESGEVNGIDLAAILAYWGTDGGKFPRTDANGDGIVDANDLAIVLSGWGNCP